MGQKELVNELLKCHGTSVRQYVRELVNRTYDDLFENVGVDYDVMGEVTRIIFEDAVDYIHEMEKEDQE